MTKQEAPFLSSAPPRGHDPVAQTIALLQPWIAQVPKQQRRLGLLIFLVLLAHMAAFFFIRIDATQTDLRRPTRTHLTVENMSGSLSDRDTDRFWDRLTDPRLFLLPSQPSSPLSAQMPPLDFNVVPLNAEASPDLVPAAANDYPFLSEMVPPLEERVAATLQPARQSFVYEEKSPTIATTTTWQWDESLTQRAPIGAPELPSPISDTDLNPTKLRVAIDANGTVDHVMVEESCGKLELDQQAIQATRKIRFRSDDQVSLLWGGITIFWHYSAPPREVVVPTPPSGP